MTTNHQKPESIARGARMLRTALGPATVPNGIAWHDGLLYVADTNLGRLWAFDIASPGVLAEPPPFQPGGA